MKKVILAMFATIFSVCMISCNSSTSNTADNVNDTIATEVVPRAATEVLPAAAPGPDAGGKVATDVIPDTLAN